MTRPDSKLASVPDRPDPDVYGHVDFFDGIETHRLSIEVEYGSVIVSGADVVLDPNGHVLKHPFDGSRDSTEEERAAVGWTW